LDGVELEPYAIADPARQLQVRNNLEYGSVPL
jgi:hypothetical protein